MSFIAPLLLSIGVIQNPPCSDAKMQEILAQPLVGDPADTSTWQNRSVSVNCSVQLQPGDVVSKAVQFVGPAASHLVFDCNGAAIEPLGILKEKQPALLVTSARTGVEEGYIHQRVRNVTVKNCKIKGYARVKGQLYRMGNEESTAYKNQRGPDYVQELRAVSPTDITLDNLDIHNKAGVSLYIEQGVTNLTLRNSRIKHDDARGPSLYIDAESAFNVIDNNEFHHSSSKFREVMAIDGSEHNVISRNWFSGNRYGGIFLYRNCGERSEVRYTGVRNNEIRDNIFYYDNTVFALPSVWIGSRDGTSLSGYCDKDSDVSQPWDISHVDPELGWDADWRASNTDDRDFARYNTVTGNRFCNASWVVGEGVEVKNGEFNFGNIVEDNTGMACDSSDPIPR